jgi:hypothetical protein
MLHEARHTPAPALVLGVQFLLLLPAWQSADRGVWALCLFLVGLASLYGWILSFRRVRAIADTPTSRIASAAQGYVELYGTATMHDGHALTSRLGRVPCVWYRYRIEEKVGRDWRHVESGASSDTFLLRDGTGECVIDPEGAEVLPVHKRTWVSAPYRFTEWTIRAGDPVYALGQFRTLGGADPTLDVNDDVRGLLADWKRDRGRLLARFDADGNGEIDLDEWEQARAAARDEVLAKHREIRALPGLHIISAPDDGRLFLLSNAEPFSLTGRYRRWLALHFLVMCGAIGASLSLAASLHIV